MPTSSGRLAGSIASCPPGAEAPGGRRNRANRRTIAIAGEAQSEKEIGKDRKSSLWRVPCFLSGKGRASTKVS